MIFLTVGTQLPFDRLISAVDDIASTLSFDIFGQIGVGGIKPKNFQYSENLHPSEFDQKFRSANLIVAHAGIGTILTAKKYRKPLILFPRIARLGEHRNDHQAATCDQVTGTTGIYIATDANSLKAYFHEGKNLLPPSMEQSRPRSEIINNLRSYIAGNI